MLPNDDRVIFVEDIAMSSLVKKALEDALSGIIETDFNVNVDLFASGNDIELNDLKIRKDCIPTYYPIK